MGKRKKSSRKPQGPKKREALATTFTCLFCNHEKAIQIKMDKKNAMGTLTCKVCGQRFQCRVNHLNAPVDVYSEWIDACETVAKQQVDAELRDSDKMAAEDRNFSTYGIEPEATPGGEGNGRDEDYY